MIAVNLKYLYTILEIEKEIEKEIAQQKNGKKLSFKHNILIIESKPICFSSSQKYERAHTHTLIHQLKVK